MAYYIYIIASVLILPSFIYGLYTQYKVNSTFNKYKSIEARNGKTASEVARTMLNQAGLESVQIKKIKGDLTDNYNPRTKTLSLSDSTYNNTSVSAIGVAAHEVGHAIQHKEHYIPVKIRSFLVPVVNLCSRLSIPLLIIGILLSVFMVITPKAGEIIVWISVAFYGSSTLFHLVTLPVELNASKRALANLSSSGILINDELPMAKETLDAAAKTYLASLFISAVYFLRFLSHILILFGRNRD